MRDFALTETWRLARARLEQTANGLDRSVEPDDDAERDEKVVEGFLSTRSCAGLEMEHGRVDEAEGDAVGLGQNLVMGGGDPG